MWKRENPQDSSNNDWFLWTSKKKILSSGTHINTWVPWWNGLGTQRQNFAWTLPRNSSGTSDKFLHFFTCQYPRRGLHHPCWPKSSHLMYNSSLLLKSCLAQILAKYFEILKPQVVNSYTIAKEKPHFRESELKPPKTAGSTHSWCLPLNTGRQISVNLRVSLIYTVMPGLHSKNLS